MTILRTILVSATLWLGTAGAMAQTGRTFTVVAYNVENLFDADGVAGFDEYKPERYTRAHVLTKAQNAAKLVAQYEQGRGPDVLIVNELEVDQTPSEGTIDYHALLAPYASLKLDDMLGAKFDRAIGDLPAEALLAKALADRGIQGYKLFVSDNATSVPGRKLDQRNAIFTRLPVKAVRSHPTVDARAVLEVQLEVDGATFYVFANHWKSGASDPATEATRIANAKTLRTRLDEILKADPHADLILGGDFNSQYNQKQRYPAMTVTGINDTLGAQGDELAVRTSTSALYNLWYELPPEKRGSDTYRGEWGTLMHLIVSRGVYDLRGVQYVDNSFAVGKFTGLNADAQGLPVRWENDGTKGAGFSDHFPVSAKFTVVKNNDTSRYVALSNPSKPSPADTTIHKTVDYAAMDVAKAAVSVPAGVSIRTPEYKGKLFRVEGTVAPGSRLAVEFRGETYDVFSHDPALREKLRKDYAEGATIRFYGELGQFRERWQFVVQHASWVK